MYNKILEFGEYPYKGKKGFVFTCNSYVKRDQNVIFSSNVLDFTEHLIRSSEKDVWLMGGLDIICILLNSNLLDEITLSVHRIILGKGIPLLKTYRPR
jgi:dihydrofolate reductase